MRMKLERTRRLERPAPLRDARRWYIATEGERTEKDYPPDKHRSSNVVRGRPVVYITGRLVFPFLPKKVFFMPSKLRLILSLLAISFLSQPLLAQEDHGIEVELLEAGTSPRQILRLKPTKGSKQSSVMTMTMAQKISMRGQKLPAPETPPMAFTIDVTINDVATNGDVNFEFVYSNVELLEDASNPSPISGVLKPILKSIEGLSGSGVVSERGFTRDSRMVIPEGVAPQLRMMLSSLQESMSRISAPFPEEEVGVGGKWNVIQMVTANGLTLKQTTTHTLKGFQGDKCDIVTEVAQSAEPQDVKVPGLPDGTTMKLKSLEFSGDGTMLFDPKSIFPTSSVSVGSQASMQIIIGGQSQDMETDTKIKLKIAPASSAATEPTK